jgi:hypothetical protein
MSTPILAIPTTYQRVQFRSRLEARWAAMFDSLGWAWDYEPLELAGYIPDFVLRFYEPLLVEVKPELTIAGLLGHTAKLDAAGWSGEILIVGAVLFPEDALGLLGEQIDTSPRYYEPALGMRCTNCTALSLRVEDGSYRCRVSGCYEGSSYIGNPGTAFRDAWIDAGNLTQWKPQR